MASGPIPVYPEISFEPAAISALCRQYGPQLHCPADVNGAQLLYALAGNESSFGRDSRPRHEMGYCTGRYSTNPLVVALTQKYGHDAHCSYGPWQTLLVNASSYTPDQLRQDPDACIRAVLAFLNREIFGRQGATTIAQVGDAYNSGNFRDANVPEQYIAKLYENYTAGMQ